MRVFRVGVVRVAVVMACVALLVGACELREGDKREYGGIGLTVDRPGVVANSETIVGSG